MSDNGTTAPKVLVVGTGFGCRIQIPALRAAGFDIVGLVGTDEQRTSERAAANGVPTGYTDLERAIADTGATAVTVATPPDKHAAPVLTAIAYGCHVLCEKPFAMNLDEARLMLDAANRAGIVHMLGYEFRWEPQRVLGAQAIADGLLGEVRMASFSQVLHYAGNAHVTLPDWWFDQAAGGGWLGASGSHTIDWVRTWLGEFESVSAALPSLSSPPEGAEDSFIVRFRLVNGVEGVLHQSGGAWGPFAGFNHVAGTKGSLWLENGGVRIADSEGARELPVPAELMLPQITPSNDPRQQSPEWQMLTARELAPYTMLCTTWREMILGKPVSSPVSPATFADGMEAIRVMDAIRISASNNGALISVETGAC